MINKILTLLKSKFLWLNVLAAVAVLVIISTIVMFCLKIYTHHGESITVPNVIGLYEHEARELFERAGLSMEIVDSVYLRNEKPGVIVEQTPKQGLSVKGGRIIFLTVNANAKREIAIPDLIGVSERQATSTLNSLGFNIGSINIVPSEYADMVLEIRHNDRILKAGDKLPDGSTLSISVGRNDTIVSGEMVVVPSLIGLSATEAERIISENNMVVGYVGFDQPQPKNDSEKLQYKVYRQMPEAEQVVIPGKRIDIWLSKDPRKQQGERDKKDDDFFN